MKLSFPSILHKEMQRIIFFICNEKYYVQDTMTASGSEAYLAEQFYGEEGNPDSCGQVKVFVKGVGVYSDAFNDDFVVSQAITKKKKVLISKLVRMSTKQVVIGDDVGDVDAALLKRKNLCNSSLVDGAFIKSQTGIIFKSIKKAIAYGNEYLDGNGAGPLGGNEDDYYEYVLDKMYLEWRQVCLKAKAAREKAKQLEAGSEEVEPDSSVVVMEATITTTRPASWMFDGFMVFVLFGRFAVGGSKFNTLKTSTWCCRCV
jgi:hypothetical protein